MPNGSNITCITTDIDCLYDIAKRFVLILDIESRSTVEELIWALQLGEFCNQVSPTKMNSFIYYIALLSSNNHVSLPKMEIKRIELNGPEACNFKVALFRRGTKSVHQWQREYAKNDESFCFRPEQGVYPQVIKENYGYLCTPYIWTSIICKALGQGYGKWHSSLAE